MEKNTKKRILDPRIPTFYMSAQQLSGSIAGQKLSRKKTAAAAQQKENSCSSSAEQKQLEHLSSSAEKGKDTVASKLTLSVLFHLFLNPLK